MSSVFPKITTGDYKNNIIFVTQLVLDLISSGSFYYSKLEMFNNLSDPYSLQTSVLFCRGVSIHYVMRGPDCSS